MARPFLALHEKKAPLLASEGSSDGETHFNAAWRHLLQALHREPGHHASRRLLAELSYPAGDRELGDDMRDALAIEISRPDASAAALITWARDQRAHGRLDEALAFFARAEASGGDRSALALERARTLFALASHISPRSSWSRWISSPHAAGISIVKTYSGFCWQSHVLFDTVPDADVGRWLVRFWKNVTHGP